MSGTNRTVMSDAIIKGKDISKALMNANEVACDVVEVESPKEESGESSYKESQETNE